MRHFIFPAATLFLALSALATAQQQRPGYDSTPRIAVLIPKGPPDYSRWYGNLKDPHTVHDGPFTYTAGTLGGVPVLLTIQPGGGGPVGRAFGTIPMFYDFNVRAVLYPGTSGGHLPKGEMGVGDIVLGAKNVNHGDYHISSSGAIDPGTFASANPKMPYLGDLYPDPKLLAMLACSAQRVAASTTLPGWLEPVNQDQHPEIFYFGIQGTSTIWSDNKPYTESTMRVFHEIDEDGDWYSNLTALLYHVPFLEVSVISNSIYAFPEADHGTPLHPAGVKDSHLLAQDISNLVALDLIARSGRQILDGHFENFQNNPYPAGSFDTPKSPGTLLARSGCQ